MSWRNPIFTVTVLQVKLVLWGKIEFPQHRYTIIDVFVSEPSRSRSLAGNNGSVPLETSMTTWISLLCVGVILCLCVALIIWICKKNRNTGHSHSMCRRIRQLYRRKQQTRDQNGIERHPLNIQQPVTNARQHITSSSAQPGKILQNYFKLSTISENQFMHGRVVWTVKVKHQILMKLPRANGCIVQNLN